MPFDESSYRLPRAIRQFGPYFGLSSFSDLVSELYLNNLVNSPRDRRPPAPGTLPPARRNTASVPSWIPFVFETVFNTSDGAYPAVARGDDSQNNLKTIISTFLTTPAGRPQPISDATLRESITIYYDGSEAVNIFEPRISELLGNSPQSGNDPWKKIVAIKSNSPYLNPAIKNADLATVFFNGMPSVELARCVPYLDVKFTFGRSTLDESGRLNAPSIYKFLMGAKQIGGNSNSTERMLVLGSSAAQATAGSVAGMELFSTPQTLINAATNTEPQQSSLRVTEVLDPFRPFLTLKGVSIDVAPTIGFFSNKTAKLEMMLHDRSRMHEVAEFVKPDFRGSTELVITYGWSHPDGPEVGNPYADMMNGSRVSETYKIRNSQFSFTETGEVNISLDLFTAGMHDLNTVTITQGTPEARQYQEHIATLREALAALQSNGGQSTSAGGSGGESSQRPVEIRGIQTLNAVADSQNLLRLSSEQIRELRELRNTLRNRTVSRSQGQTAQRARVLAAEIDRLFGTGNNFNSGEVASLRTSIVTDFRDQARAVLRSSVQQDPFYPTGFSINGVRSFDRNSLPGGNSNANGSAGGSARTATTPARNEAQAVFSTIANGNTVSLAKILLNFVAKPLAATDNYEEVQLIFYPFNESAGYASRLNIGEFPVDKRFFSEQYLRFRMESISRSANMTLNEFVSWLSSVVVDDMANPVYGISTLFRSTATGNTRLEAGTQIANPSNFQIELENRLRDVTPGGDFKHPVIQCYVEAVPVKQATSNSGARPPDFSRKVLRLHFFDRQSTMYSSQAAILQASRAQQLGSFGLIPPESTGSAVVRQRREFYNQIVQRAVDSDLVRREGDNSYSVVGGFGRIKEFLYETMPYIIYGAQGTTIKSAQLTSQQNELLGSVNQIRSLQASPIRANGEQPGGLPLQVIPAELGVSMIGCNLVELQQQYFIDFKTGTSVDNIYVINGVTHKIDPGSFTTDLKFVFVDGYGHYRSYIRNLTDFRDRIRNEEQRMPAQQREATRPQTSRPQTRRR